MTQNKEYKYWEPDQISIDLYHNELRMWTLKNEDGSLDEECVLVLERRSVERPWEVELDQRHTIKDPQENIVYNKPISVETFLEAAEVIKDSINE